MKNNSFSQPISIFQGEWMPEEGFPAGYLALISTFNIQAPRPDLLAMISLKHKQYQTVD